MNTCVRTFTALCAVCLVSAAVLANVRGAIFTAVSDGMTVNGNIFQRKVQGPFASTNATEQRNRSRRAVALNLRVRAVLAQ